MSIYIILQLQKRGRRKGTRNKLKSEVTKKLGDANLHYAHGRYEDVCVSLLHCASSNSLGLEVDDVMIILI